MKVAPIRTMKVERPLKRQRIVFGARIKIMSKEQLVDPPIDYITLDQLSGANKKKLL